METTGTAPVRNLGLRVLNLAASTTVVLLACGSYALAPWTEKWLDRDYGPPWAAFSGTSFLAWAAAAYVALLAAYFLIEPDPGVSKSLKCLRFVRTWLSSPVATTRRGWTDEERLAVLSTLLKAFFGPLMAVWLMGFCMNAWVSGLGSLELIAMDVTPRALFDTYGFWFVLQFILFFDVLVFTVGYLVESPRLGNAIRSVDPTLLGWTAAMLCYPPFNVITARMLGSQHTEFPQFEDATLHFFFNVAILVLMTIYASASIALGLKASNLTHRGIVDRGPYRYVRHPAYIAKNAAWWIGSIPLVSAAFDESLYRGVLAIGSVIGISLLYLLRALTEEDHLRGVDGEYAAYAERVRYRFIPGVI